jgi:hypothetical protein
MLATPRVGNRFHRVTSEANQRTEGAGQVELPGDTGLRRRTLRHGVLCDRREPGLEVLRVHDPSIRLGWVPDDRAQLSTRDCLHDGSVGHASCSRRLTNRQVAADGSWLI